MTPLSANAPVLCTEPRFFLNDPKSMEGVDDFFTLKDELKTPEEAEDELMEDVEWAERRSPEGIGSADEGVGVADPDLEAAKPEPGIVKPEVGVVGDAERSISSSSTDESLEKAVAKESSAAAAAASTAVSEVSGAEIVSLKPVCLGGVDASSSTGVDAGVDANVDAVAAANSVVDAVADAVTDAVASTSASGSKIDRFISLIS